MDTEVLAHMTPPRRPPTDFEKAWPWMVRSIGIIIALYETIFEHADRPSIILLAAGCLGLSEFIKFGRKNGGA